MGAKIAIAHRNRYHPTLKQIEKLIESGELGRFLEIRGRGLGDRRGGGEDLWVLGCHIMNLIHYFAGEPKSCSAIMLQDGRPITARDIKEGAEGLGPLAANEVHARYETAKGVTAYYDSIANDGTKKDAYCMQLIGSQGTVTPHIDRDPVAHFTPGNPYKPTDRPRRWIPITTAGLDQPEAQPNLVANVHNHVLGVTDLIEACDEDRDPLCDVRDGAGHCRDDLQCLRITSPGRQDREPASRRARQSLAAAVEWRLCPARWAIRLIGPSRADGVGNSVFHPTKY